MAYEVKNVREINYRNMSDNDIKSAGVYGLDALVREANATSFYKDDDYYVLYCDEDRHSDHDLNMYAVYLNSTGELLCLLSDAGQALDCCYDNTDFRDARHEMYRKIALLAGWPENISQIAKPYAIAITRTITVKVFAGSLADAQAIGETLASGNSELGTCFVNNAICNGDDELGGVYEYEGGFVHDELSKSQSFEVLQDAENGRWL